MSSQISYGLITPNLGTGTPVAISDFEQLLGCINSLASEHDQFVAKYRNQREEHIQDQEVGFSFYLKNRNEGLALVGVSNKGWVIYQMEPKPIKRIMSNNDNRGIVAFLLPDRTEFHEREMISPERGEAILRRWLDSLSTEISE